MSCLGKSGFGAVGRTRNLMCVDESGSFGVRGHRSVVGCIA